MSAIEANTVPNSSQLAGSGTGVVVKSPVTSIGTKSTPATSVEPRLGRRRAFMVLVFATNDVPPPKSNVKPFKVAVNCADWNCWVLRNNSDDAVVTPGARFPMKIGARTVPSSNVKVTLALVKMTEFNTGKVGGKEKSKVKLTTVNPLTAPGTT